MTSINIVKIVLLLGILVCLIVTCILSLVPISLECHCEDKINSSTHEVLTKKLKTNNTSKHKLAILVPFRDRFEELLQFVPHMNKFLSKQNIDFDIFILNQIDRFRFNRASLINVGFLYTKKDYDYIAMHDVDLLPMNDNLLYTYPERGPLHIASPKYHPKYHYESFVGGILLVKREHFAVMNGMSNKYWGWGLEDDEFFVRIKDAGLAVSRHTNIETGPSDTFRHIHDRNHRKRDTQKCFNQKEITRKRDRQTGLNSVMYKISTVNKLTIDETPVTVVNIMLECNLVLTPWCNCTAASKK